MSPEEHEPLSGAEEREPLPADGILEPTAADVPEADGPVCRACGTPLADEQDWCLECGTAVTAPRRLPGLRALSLAGALTLVLAGGAVAAAYAALSEQAPPPETKVKTVATAAPPPPTTTAPPVTDTTPVTPVEPVSPLTSTTPVTPVAPVTPVTPVTPTTTTTPSTTTTTTTTTTKPVNPPIVLAAGAGSLYDPQVRATASGDPQRAIDGNPATSWFVTTPAGGDMDVGYLLDLGEPMALKRLVLATKTPGFSFQVYGADGADPPQSITDPGWTQLAGAGSVDATPPAGQPPAIAPAPDDKAGDGLVTLKLETSGKSKKYQQLLLWFTVPPTAGPTVRLIEIKLYG
ncbi:MAG TPA: hypothetical protein VMT10_03925 [Solirubrobacteraceae bacterium]|nr:hypothetical protein [Solirubrobacteraceae bacterium]